MKTYLVGYKLTLKDGTELPEMEILIDGDDEDWNYVRKLFWDKITNVIPNSIKEVLGSITFTHMCLYHPSSHGDNIKSL